MTIVDQSTANTGASIGDLMVSGGSNHTKGAYDEAIASTSEETYWITLVLKGAEADESYLVDISVGAASSEVVRIANIPYFGNPAVASGVLSVTMPLTIAASSRVAVRCQATFTSQNLEYMIYLSNDDSFGTSTSNETIGVSTATSFGTDVTPDGTINTKGAYAELIASTSINSNYVVVFCGNSDSNGQTNQSYLVDIATGSAASEVDELINIPFVSNAVELDSQSYSFFHSISSGTRLSSRCQSDNVAASLIDVSVIAFDIVAPAGGGGGIAHIVGQGGIVG